jgi:nucleotide-binding universal stress UspA family protein
MNENGTSKKVAVVTVGVDGSAGSMEALRWALAEARLRKAPLRIVHTYTTGDLGMSAGGYGYMGGFSSSVPGVTFSDLQDAAAGLIEQMIGALADPVDDVQIERQVINGGAAATLVGAVAAGDLLVVGSRGHGGFAGLLLGSVSQQCVHHAPCPVVVVHPPKATPSDQEVVPERRAQTDATV